MVFTLYDFENLNKLNEVQKDLILSSPEYNDYYITMTEYYRHIEEVKRTLRKEQCKIHEILFKYHDNYIIL